jgi:hypothetical protein
MFHEQKNSNEYYNFVGVPPGQPLMGQNYLPPASKVIPPSHMKISDMSAKRSLVETTFRTVKEDEDKNGSVINNVDDRNETERRSPVQ